MLNDTLTRLQKMTIECNEVMHESDNDGISAKVFGNHLDNAMGANPEYNCGEFTVAITKEYRNGETVTDYFNLSDLIALARKAQL